MTQNIGVKIKDLRETAGISPEEFAERAAVTTQQLEMIETGKALPSLAVVSRILRVLGIRIGTLLDGMENTGPIVTRANERKAAVSFSNHDSGPRENLDFYSLAEGKTDRHMEPFVVRVEKSAPPEEIHLSQHEGEEFLYILDGELTLVYGKETYVLKRGDSIYYDSIVPHYLSSTASEGARILAVLYNPF